MELSRLVLIFISLCAGLPAKVCAAIRFDNFKSVQGLDLIGDARISGNTLRLTRAKMFRSGAVWFSDKQRVAAGFTTTFQFQITKPGGLGHGADGFAFVLQNAGPQALGGRGSSGGFAVGSADNEGKSGIPWSVAVFFDTFLNADEGDPSSNYIAVCTYGRPADMHWPAPRLAFTPDLSVQLKDRSVHTARILFEPPVLSVFLDDAPEPVLRTTVDLSIVVDPQGEAWVGFTSSTGAGYENHDILSWSFERPSASSEISVTSADITFPMSDCLPGRNLCTPERAFVEPNEHGYHIVLPANKEWGASIPKATDQPARIVNAHGVVCWALVSSPGNCSGPAGLGAAANQEFLVRGAPPGALVMKSDAHRTWFSVNGRTTAFTDNQGFYDFDVQVR